MPFETSRLIRFLTQVRDCCPEQFSGIGLIAYRSPLELPVKALVPNVEKLVDLPESLEAGISLLGELADGSRPFHDGFHLVEVGSMALTHICQYIAPPIPVDLPHWQLVHPVGARYMTALLASLMPCVELAAALSATGEMSVFSGGAVTDVNLNRIAKEYNDQR